MKTILNEALTVYTIKASLYIVYVLIIMFNPVIVRKSGPYETEEGCLSLPGVRKTKRYQNIEIEYYDWDWKKQRQKFIGWPAQICQHEMDHLEGILI